MKLIHFGSARCSNRKYLFSDFKKTQVSKYGESKWVGFHALEYSDNLMFIIVCKRAKNLYYEGNVKWLKSEKAAGQ